MKALALLAALAGVAASKGIMVPLFSYPKNDSWDPFYRAALDNRNLRFLAVLRPDHGPGASFPEDLVNGLFFLNLFPHTSSVGWIDIAYGQAPIDLVRQNISLYANWSATERGPGVGVQGIFFDHVPSTNTTGITEYMSNITDHMYETFYQPTVVFNIGQNGIPKLPNDTDGYPEIPEHYDYATDLVIADVAWSEDNFAAANEFLLSSPLDYYKSTVSFKNFTGNATTLQSEVQSLVDRDVDYFYFTGMEGYEKGLDNTTTVANITGLAKMMSNLYNNLEGSEERPEERPEL